MTSHRSSDERSGEGGVETEFARMRDQRQHTLVREFLVFIVENKAYWMIPILLALGIMGTLALLMSTGAAPFIYPLF